MCFCRYLIMGNAGVVVMFVMWSAFLYMVTISCPGCPRCNNSVVCIALFLPLPFIKVDCKHLSELLA